MAFSKISSLCNQPYSSLFEYMPDIRNTHSKESPKSFVKELGGLRWKLRNDD